MRNKLGDRHLTIVSVPFHRIARVSLSQLILELLRERSDVAIVAPFADSAKFRRDFDGPRTTFLRWQLNGVGRVEQILTAASEILRRNGFWKRFARRGLSYYLENQNKVFGRDGQDTELRPGRRLANRILANIGRWPLAWQLVDQLLRKRWYGFPQLEQLSTQYARVTLIQSANWGLQDRALARLSRRQNWRAILLPYTTDQLDTNGYLLNRYDEVCVQGTYEFARALEFHALPRTKIRRLGSAWFRHLECVKTSICSRRTDEASGPGFLLYAGVSSTYYPRDAEILAVDAIAAYLSRSRPRMKLVYRPVESDPSRKKELLDHYAGSETVRLQWPTGAELGLEEYSDVEQSTALRMYIQSLMGCRLLVMSYVTSLAMDVVFLQPCGVISNMSDPAGILRRRKTHLLNTQGTPGIRFVTSNAELLQVIETLLDDPERAAQESARIIAQWDYPDVDFKSTFIDAVYGTSSPAGAGD